ncbi:hypothetical protein Ancab_039085 [Ancistrocladus abbreviatus]
MEFVPCGSEQSNPSTEAFDFGVDNLISPMKYIVWSVNKNTHILHEYVISFKAASSLRGSPGMETPMKMPTSPRMPFPALMSLLSKFLPPHLITLINKNYNDLPEKKDFEEGAYAAPKAIGRRSAVDYSHKNMEGQWEEKRQEKQSKPKAQGISTPHLVYRTSVALTTKKGYVVMTIGSRYRGAWIYSKERLCIPDISSDYVIDLTQASEFVMDGIPVFLFLLG